MAPLDCLRAWALIDSTMAGFAVRMLVELGAQVELLDPPDGSALRRMPPLVDGESMVFSYLVAGTTSREQPADLPDLDEVAVVLHDRAELPKGWDEAIESAPLPASGRVVVACTPYGLAGPRNEWEATELTVFQSSGEGAVIPAGLSYEEFPDRAPGNLGRYAGSYQAGTAAAVAALAGLRSSRAADRTEWVDLSSQDAQLSLNHLVVSRYAEGSVERRANRGFSYGGVLRCADGYVELLPIEQHHWDGLRELMGDPEWARDPALEDTVERGRRGAEINGHLRAWAAEQSMADVVDRAAEAGVPCGPFQSPGELQSDRQFQARRFFRAIDGDSERVAPGAAWRFTADASPNDMPGGVPPPLPSDGASA